MDPKRSRNVIGAEVRKHRLQQNLSQQDLAARCNLCGFDIGRETVSQIERGVRGVSDLEMILISKALRVRISAIVPQLLPPWRKDLRPPNAVG